MATAVVMMKTMLFGNVDELNECTVHSGSQCASAATPGLMPGVTFSYTQSQGR